MEINNKVTKNYIENNKIRKLNIGCGDIKLEGWLNVDIDSKKGEAVIDARKEMPFDSETFDYIYGEHFIEHLTYEEGLKFLKECNRVLKKDGRLRMSTPDLEFLIELYNKGESKGVNIEDMIKRHERITGQENISKEKYFNDMMHFWGHKYIYNISSLNNILAIVGFNNIKKFDFGMSNDTNLQNIEKHQIDELSKKFVLIVEADKKAKKDINKNTTEKVYNLDNNYFKSKQSKNDLISNLISGKTVLTIRFNDEFIENLNKNKFIAENVESFNEIQNIDKQFDTLIFNKDINIDENIIKKGVNLLENGGRIIFSLSSNKNSEIIDSTINKNKNYISKTDYITSNNYLIKTFFIKKEKSQAIQNEPTVDILMPTYNGRKYISKAIESIINQTFENWKLYIINDGGEDIKDIVEKFKDERIIYIIEEHKGKSHALNIGLKNGKGEYVTYLDDDDIIYPIHLETLLSSLKNSNEYGFAFNDTYEIKLKNNTEIHRGFENREDVTPGMLLVENYINHKCIMHKRSVINNTGYYDESLKILIDWDYIRKLACSNKYFRNTVITSEHYLRLDENDKTKSRITGLWNDDIKGVEKSINKIADNTQNIDHKVETFKYALIKSLKGMNYVNTIINKKHTKAIANKDNVIKDKDNEIKDKDNVIKNKDNVIKDKDNVIKDKDNVIKDKDKALEDLYELNNTYLGKINWVMHNPKKFMKKYIQKIKWVICNPWKFIKKHFISRFIKLWKKIIWGIFHPIKFYKKYSEKIKYLSREHSQHLKNEGFLSATKRTLNYLILGKGVIDSNTKDASDLKTLYNKKVKAFEKNIKKREYKNIKKSINNFEYKPKISIIVPVYNVSKKWLGKCIDSAIDQCYENWELCLQDDASTEKETLDCLKFYKKKDKRIKVGYSKKNKHISITSNKALELATGDYIALLDNDDEITPDALYEIVKELNKNKKLDFIYSDEDKIDMSGNYCDPHFKSDYNPDLLLSQNYICHLAVIRRSLVEKIGGFRAGYEGSQDYDLFLRVVEKTKEIYHIPKVLYHWRKIPGSTAAEYGSKNYAWERGKNAVEDVLDRRNIEGRAELGEFPGSYHVIRKIKDNPLISIIIPFKDYPDLLDCSIGSILKKSTYKNFEIIGISNNSEQKETFDKMEHYKKLDSRVRFYEYNVPFNYSKINNFATNKCRGEHIVLMNNDIKVITPDWIEQLLQQSQRSEVGAVGAKLYYPDNTIQHAGVILKIGGIAGHSHKYYKKESLGYFGRPKLIQNISAVTAALLMVKKDFYDKLNGLDENLKVAFNDVDFCLRLREQRYLNVYTPYCEMYHYESKSRGKEDTEEKIKRFRGEIEYFKKRHKNLFLESAYDPYYNPNLTLSHEDFSLNNNKLL